MTISSMTRPAPLWLRELADGRATYEELLGWPVSLQVKRGNLVVAVGSVVGAVTMPAGLGARVRNDLRIAMLCGPIIADPAGTQWTFLTRPITAIRPSVAEELTEWRITLAAPGNFVTIPTGVSLSDGTSWRWVEQPVPNRALPPAQAVIGVSRRLMDGAVVSQLAG